MNDNVIPLNEEQADLLQLCNNLCTGDTDAAVILLLKSDDTLNMVSNCESEELTDQLLAVALGIEFEEEE